MIGLEPLSVSDGMFEAYASLAAHQLGEAVTLMRASVSILDSDGNGGAAADARRGLRAGAERAQRFVDDLIGVTSVTRAPPQIEEVDLAPMLGEAQGELASALTGAGAHIDAGPLPAVEMDPRQARLALAHLLRVALAAGAREIDVRITTADGGGAVLEVRDDGAPPLPGTESRAFEPFAPVRGRGALVGAGISLPLCRLIAIAHGGHATIRRLDDGRTLTSLHVPRSSAA